MILRRLVWCCFLTTLAVPMAHADILTVMRNDTGVPTRLASTTEALKRTNLDGSECAV